MTIWNALIDTLMPALSPVDWKIASYLWDTTNRGSERVQRTIDNIAHQTKLDRGTVMRGLLRLKAKGVISVYKEDVTSVQWFTWTWRA